MRLRGTNRNFRRVSPRVPFNPRKLFRNSEQGVWYDPSDLSTLFKDSAGTTPVTAVEQPVGLMLDKRLGLVLGPELVTNGTFDSNLTGWTNLIGTAQVVSGRARVIRPSNNSIGRLVSAVLVCTPGRTYRITAERYAGTAAGSDINVTNNSSSVAQGTVLTNISVTDGVFTGYFTATQSNHWVFLQTRNGAEIDQFCEFDNISVRELPGNHAFQSTAIDRPILRQDAGGRYYLAANGTNTWMQTNSIDFSSTDKVTVFAGVRKLSDGPAFKLIAELSANTDTNNGSFMIGAGTSADASRRNYAWGVSRGFSSSQRIDAPHSAVIAARHDITQAASLAAIQSRVNGSATTNVAGPAVTTGAAFDNYPLFLFRRGGVSNAADINFYGLLIRGALTSDPDILKMEKWLSFKTGVQL